MDVYKGVTILLSSGETGFILSTLDFQLGVRHHYDMSTVDGGHTDRKNLFGSRCSSWSYPRMVGGMPVVVVGE